MFLIGVISDTHGLLRPEAVRALRGADAIIHAGDIGKPEILKELRDIAPVTAVRGNNDKGEWAVGLADREFVEFEGFGICVLHDLKELDVASDTDDVRVVIAGHSHKPLVEDRGGVLYVNPGSAGPRRFKLPVTVALLRIEGGVTAEIVDLL